MKARWIQFWEGLNDRERRVAIVGGVVLILYAVYVVYSALAKAVLENEASLREKKETLAWMKIAKGQISPQKKQQQVLDGSKGLTVFSETLKRSPFHDSPYQLQQVSEGTLQLSFDSVPYNAFLGWLAMMNMRYHLEVKSFHAEKTDTSGVVKLTVVIVL